MKEYNKIIAHYERCLDKHGDNHLGVDWPKLEDVDTRYKIMLDIIKLNEESDRKVSLLDFGCGTGHLLDFVHRNNKKNIIYSGLDISQKFIDVAKKKYPDNSFYCIDILDSKDSIGNFDYVVMNGVFTEKRELSYDEMWNYFTKMITVIYEKCNNGFAFNVMSKNVDWEREDLFHVSHDILSSFLCANLTRNYIIRNDYGLYEYTVYVFKK
ncbi:class I SAM-dependent methyltransferase [Flavobacterium sp. MDT1-60]|uniref:class I SAM-dependent methyltransferase n=1 Tax=Flavobacterium sp. MDT1-60 TaxID=1979344 RepID=UPI00177B1BAF|nr:class I SAM-dependent methyltransferase [Flavobacterium sp. MDT1-60]QOG03801.1 class I SAM-dependent methyltransferase [Flavobacterium sp. MDT1-60]